MLSNHPNLLGRGTPGGPPGPGDGDVVGPASSTDNAITRFNGTDGKLIQNSTVLLSDNGDLQIPSTATVGTQWFNTADKVTTVERIDAVWGSNIFSLGYRSVGAGAGGRPMVLFAQSNAANANYNQFRIDRLASPFIRQGLYTTATGDTLASTTTTGNLIAFGNGTYTASSGDQSIFAITPTAAQTGTAGWTAFRVRVDTSGDGGSGTKLLMQLGTAASASLITGTNTGAFTAVTVSDSKGEVRNIPQNSQSAAYTTVLADAGKHILHPTADNNARTFTIDSNANVAYPVGTAITFVNQINTVTIAITSDTLVFASDNSTGSRTLAAGGMATAIKIATTTWVISGAGLT